MKPKAARKRRGWSRYRARLNLGLSDSVLERLEEEPEKAASCELGTIIRLIDGYRGDVNLPDLLPGCAFRLTKVDDSPF